MNSRFRPRPIDFGRAMPVVKSQNELDLNDEGILVPKKVSPCSSPVNISACLVVDPWRGRLWGAKVHA